MEDGLIAPMHMKPAESTANAPAMIFIPPRTGADLSKLAEPASEDIKNAMQLLAAAKVLLDTALAKLV